MRLVFPTLCFCAVALGQTAPVPTFQLPQTLTEARPNLWEERLKSLKLIEPSHVAIPQMVAAVKPKACAIPLLNALPAQPKVDYKMRVFKPAENVEGSNAATPQIGLPACEPVSVLKPAETK